MKGKQATVEQDTDFLRLSEFTGVSLASKDFDLLLGVKDVLVAVDDQDVVGGYGNEGGVVRTQLQDGVVAGHGFFCHSLYLEVGVKGIRSTPRYPKVHVLATRPR